MAKLRARFRRLRDLLLHYSSLKLRRFAAMEELRRQYQCADYDLSKSALWTSGAMSHVDTAPRQSSFVEDKGDWHAEKLIRDLFFTLTDAQRREICIPWDAIGGKFGLSRTFVANHWQVTAPSVSGGFFTQPQQTLIGEIFRSLVDPAWHMRFLRQLSDDTKGHPFGQDQSIAILGDPQNGPFQFLFTGRHITLRADGGTKSGLAFGGPIVYGHAAGGRFFEKPGHPGNVFWPQSIAAGRVFSLLTPKQKLQAVVAELPDEHNIGFRPYACGVSVSSFSADQRAALVVLLHALMSPFRTEDRKRILYCLNRQGGIDALKLAFSNERRLSKPEWDIWRLEGPFFVWHFQGYPHVHCWVHIAAEEQPDEVNSHRGAYLFSNHDPLI